MTSAKRWSPYLQLAVKALLGVTVLVLLFVATPPQKVLDALSGASPAYVLPAFLLVPVHVFFRVLRWRQLLSIAGESLRWSRDTATILIGYALSTVTPLDAGDYVGRIRSISTIAPVRVVALTIVEKIINGVLVLLLGIPAAIALHLNSASAGLLAITVGVALLLLAALFRRRLTGLPALRRIMDRFGWTSGLTTIHDMSLRSLLPVVGSSVAVLLVVYSQEYLLLNAVTTASLLQTWQGYWAGIGVRVLAPIFLGDLGIREATHVYFFGLLGIDTAAALSASLSMFFLNVLLPTIGGLLLWLTSSRKS